MEEEPQWWEFTDEHPSGDHNWYRLEKHPKGYLFRSNAIGFAAKLRVFGPPRILKFIGHLVERHGKLCARDSVRKAISERATDATVTRYLEQARKLLGDDGTTRGTGEILCGRIIESISGSFLRFASPVKGHDDKPEGAISSVDGFIERLRIYALGVVDKFRIVRPLLDVPLPAVDLSRGAHFVERFLTYYGANDSSEQTPPSIRETTSEVLDRLLDGRRHLGLVAQAGMGKSAVLEHLVFLGAARLAAALASTDAPLRAQDDGATSHPLPVIVRLGAVRHASDIARQIQEQLLSGGQLKLLDLDKCELIVFVDGLDELPTGKADTETQAAVGATLLDLVERGADVAGTLLRVRSSVLASRPETIHLCNTLPHFRNADFREKGVAPHVLSLDPLSVQQQVQYVKNFFYSSLHTAAKEQSQKLQQSLGALSADSPFLLFLVCYITSASASGTLLPQTSTQLLLLGVRRSLAGRKSCLTEAHLKACAAIAFEHRLHGSLNIDGAVRSLAIACQDDIDSEIGLAAALDVRRTRNDEKPSTLLTALPSLIKETLSTQTGLLRLNFDAIFPVDSRVGDLLVAYHLRELTRKKGFGFDSNRRVAIAAARCINDPASVKPASQTIAQTVARWAWSGRWSAVMLDFAVLLAEDDMAQSLIQLLAVYEPVNGIDTFGDDDGGHRLILAMECWRTASPICGSERFDILKKELLTDRSLRKLSSPKLDNAVERLSSPSVISGASRVLAISSSNDEYEINVRKLLHLVRYGNTDMLLQFVRRNISELLADQLIAIRERDLSIDPLPDSVLQDLAEAIRQSPQTHHCCLGVFARTLQLLGINVYQHMALIDLLSKRPITMEEYKARNRPLCESVITLLFEQALVYAIEYPELLDILLLIQSDRELDKHEIVSDVFRGRPLGSGDWTKTPDPFVHRYLSPEAVQILTKYVACGEPGYYGTSLQDSAICLLARMRPSRHDSDQVLSAEFCRALQEEQPQIGLLVIRELPRLRQYNLDYGKIYESIKIYVGRAHDGAALTDPLLYRATLECIRAVPSLDDSWLLHELKKCDRLPLRLLAAFVPYNLAVAKRFGVAWNIIDCADTDSDYGTSADYRRVGFTFLQENARALCSDEEFLSHMFARQRSAYSDTYSEIFLTVMKHSGSSDVARQFLLRLRAISPDATHAVLSHHSKTLFEIGIRIRLRGDNGDLDIETADRLTAGIKGPATSMI